MEMDIIKVIQELGFPISCVVAMACFIKSLVTKTQNTLDKVTEINSQLVLTNSKLTSNINNMNNNISQINNKVDIIEEKVNIITKEK